MIGHWPDPLLGELLYGTLARLTRRTAPPDLKAAMHELFGDPHVQAVVDLPGNLDHLVAVLPPGHAYTAGGLIDEHTTLPFYEPFLPAGRAIAVRAAMRGGGRGSSVHLMLGLMAGRVPAPRWLRFCPACERENIRDHGEPSWQRLHQIAGVEVCPVHEMFLNEDRRARRLSPRTRHNFLVRAAAEDDSEDRPIQPLNPLHGLLLRLARGAAWLLDGPRDFHPGPAMLREGYVELLAERGLASHSGRLRVEVLTQEFLAHHSHAPLAHLASGLPARGGGWLVALLRSREKVQNPIRHLLLMDFLGHDPKSFFARLRAGAGVFGAPPWPCLNPVCAHHRHNVIARVTVAHHAERKRPVGEFRCPRCGFTYLRDGPDRAGEHRNRANAVRDYGPRWRTVLRRLWVDPKRSLRALSRILGVDPLTAKRRAADLGLPFPRTVSARASSRPPSTRRAVGDDAATMSAADDQAAWLEAVREAPTASVKELRARLPALYMRLYRHDRAWLRQHRPPPRRPARPATVRVDWPARDAALAADVPAATARLLSRPGRPIQINTASLGRELAALALVQKHRAKLPATTDAIAAVAEDRAAFACRRLAWAVSRFRAEGVCPPLWRLARRAGLRPELAALPRVAAALRRGLYTLGWRSTVPGLSDTLIQQAA